MPNYVPGTGPLQSKIMIVGEAPGKYEDEYCKPFVGPTGDLLDELLAESGIQRTDCYVTNVVKYRPPDNDFKRLSEIGVDLKQQIENLWKEIRQQRPNIIIALGDKALAATTGKSGINNYRGSILRSKDGTPKVIATFHPANLLYQRGRQAGKGMFKYAWKYVMIADLKRAKEQSKTPEYSVPDRILKIARNSLDLYRFLERNKHRSIVDSDIESINCVPVCVGFAFDKHEAISVPLYRKFAGVSISDNSLIDIAERWELIAKTLKEKSIIGHNWKYDEEKLYRLGLHSGELHADTLLLEHTLNPELPSKKLHVISSIRTLEPYYKEEGSEFRFGKDDIDQLFLYNGKDCAVDYEVFEDQDAELREMADLYSPKLVDFYYGYVRKLHHFYIEMERVGYKTNEVERARLHKKYRQWHNEIQKRFIENVGRPVNVGSPKQLFKLLYQELNCPMRKDTGEDSIVSLLTNVVKDEKRKAILSDILEDRRVRKADSTYILAKPDYDGRMRSSYFITGTETGRSSTGVLKPPVRPNRLGWSDHQLPKHGDIGPDVRLMLEPDEGYVFLNVDLAQAEARIVAVLAEDWDLLKAFDSIDIHRRTAGLVFDMISFMDFGTPCSNPEVDKIGKDSGERFVGKKTRHAGNYDMGPETHHKDVMAVARRSGIKLDYSEYRASRALQLFHEASPKIRGIFHRDIKHAIDTTRVLVNPYGRVRMFLDRPGEAMYREAYADIPQSTVHDTLTGAGIRIKDRIPDLRFVAEKHDSFTVLAKCGEEIQVAKIMQEEIERPIDFTYGSIKRSIQLIIPADFEIGYKNLKEMEKLKV